MYTTERLPRTLLCRVSLRQRRRVVDELPVFILVLREILLAGLVPQLDRPLTDRGSAVP